MRIRQATFILVFVLLLLIFYSNRFFQAGANPGEDVLEHDVPLAQFFVRSIQQGGFPHWNPHKAYGLPACEIPFMGPYYPLFVLYFLLPTEWAINAGFLVHIGLSAFFFFLLCRELRQSPLIAFFCASSWALSSVFQQYAESGWLPETVGTAYLPGALWLVVKSRGARGHARFLLNMAAGVCLALGVAGNHPANSLVNLSTVVFFCIPFLRNGSDLRSLALLLLFALLLSVVAWGPLLAQYSSVPPSPDPREGYSPAELLNFLSPVTIGRGFVGRPVLILGLIGFFLRRQPHGACFRVVLLISLGLSLCAASERFDQIPFINGIRYTWQWHLGLILALIVFAGTALTRLRDFLTHRLRPKTTVGLLLSGLLVLQLLDLYRFDRRFYPRGFTYSLQEYFESPVVEILKQDTSLFRVVNRPHDSPAFRKNQGTVDGIDCIDARIKGVSIWRVTGDGTLSCELYDGRPRSWNDLCNVKYVIEEVFDQSQLRLLREDGFRIRCAIRQEAPGEVRLFVLLENERCFPRAFLVTGAEVDQVVSIFRGPGDERLAGDPLSQEVYDALSRHQAVEITRTINTYRIGCSADEEGVLFLSEMYDPGWKATVDGERTEIFLPFGFLMAVKVPPGPRTVILEYRPLRIYTLWLVNVLAVLATVVIAVVVWRRRGADQSPERLGEEAFS